MKFRKGARQEFRQLKKQKKHAQSVRYLQWQQNGHGGGGKIQKSKGAVNMRGINGQMNRIFTQLDIYERPQPEKPKAPDNEEEEIHSDDSEVDLGDRLERAYSGNGEEKVVEVKETREERIAKLKRENEAEEKEIARLEKLLYLNKRKNNNMPKSFVDEGLDFLMEVVDKKYKRRYNDDMELLSEQKGELTNALTGNDPEASDDEEEESSGDEITQQNEKRRKIRFSDQRDDEGSENSDQVGSEGAEDMDDMDEEVEEDSDEEMEGDFDEEPEGDFDEDSEDEMSAQEGSEEYSDEEEEAPPVDMKGRSKAQSLKKAAPSSTKGGKQNKSQSAEDVMAQLKAMREAKKGVKTEAKVPGKKEQKAKPIREEADDDSEEDLDDEEDFDEDGSEVEDDEPQSNEDSDAEGAEGGSDEETVKADDFIRKKNKVAEDGTYEDIYGRKRNADGEVLEATAQKYVPPAKRLAMGGGDKNNKIELEKLQKQVKGQLNRLSETNLRPIATLFSELYSRHSKNNVTSTLSLAIGDGVFGLAHTPERLVLEPALLCALLHANEGHEVGAQILEDLVDRLKSLLEDEEERSKGKQLENVLRFLCYLFLFKVVSHGIIYGVLNKLDPTNENDIELILVILRTCGFALRKCDPLALKELIVSLQAKSQNSSSSTRHRFMLETLSALKNNNISKISNCDPSLSERALKSLRNCLNKGAVLQELNVSLDDLYDARVKGKWWLVGSAWTRDGPASKTDSSKDGATTQTGHADEFSDKIKELARKAGMNTDIRRSIFCIIMSAEDYLDASERILRLNLTHVQQREFCYVLLLCAGNEKRFNPYYGHLALFFCNKNKKVFSMTLQCAIWDAIKAIGTYAEGKVSNLAHFTALLIQRGGLPLAVLKNIEFVDLSNDKVIQFIRVLLLDVLLNMESDKVSTLFAKIALAGPKLQLLKEGLGVFLKRFLLRNVKLDSDQTKTVRKNIKAAEEGLHSQADKSEVDIFE